MESNRKDKRCSVCGRYFRPDRRARGRQKTCGKEDCRRKHKSRSQAKWLKRNPGYFSGRYVKIKAWREGHPGYQKVWRANRKIEIQDETGRSKPVPERELLIRAVVPGSKIQDEILSVRLTGQGVWEVGAKKSSEIQDEIARNLLCTVGYSL
jgi:hypothetical protein